MGSETIYHSWQVWKKSKGGLMPVKVFFDACVIDRLAAYGIDPVRDLAGTNFQIAYTPDLKQEYAIALAHTAPSDQTKALLRLLLQLEATQTGTLTSFFGLGEGPWLGLDQGEWASPTQIQTIGSISTGANRPTGIPRKRTDIYLAAMAESHIIITANTNDAHWKKETKNQHVIQWERDLKPRLETGETFVAALESLVT